MGNRISYTTVPHTLSLGVKGSITGTQNDDKAVRYAGIPYALQPTGSRRWKRPEPLPTDFVYASPEGKPYDATKFRGICPQKAFHIVPAEGGNSEKYSEECLFVNIWTPVSKPGAPRKKWPVKLWIHGGWFQMGDPSHEEGMDPTELIATSGLDAIVVAIGYRLNIFGFFACEALGGGNFGLWDQRCAMQWVRDNIHCFGGDPDNVTLAGRSAGAYSVHAQMLHEFRRPRTPVEDEELGTQQLFRRVFMCSNAIPAQPKTLAEVEEQFDEVCTYFKIPSAASADEKLEQLRAIPSGQSRTINSSTLAW